MPLLVKTQKIIPFFLPVWTGIIRLSLVVKRYFNKNLLQLQTFQLFMCDKEFPDTLDPGSFWNKSASHGFPSSVAKTQ